MPHAAKPLQPLDVEVVKVLQEMIDTSGVSRAQIAIAARIGNNRSGRIFRFQSPGDPDFAPIPPSEEDVWRLAANFTREDVERSRLEEIGEESQLPPEERDDHIA